MLINLKGPIRGKDSKETEQHFYEWAHDLTEALNIVLANIGEDNLSENLKKALMEDRNG